MNDFESGRLVLLTLDAPDVFLSFYFEGLGAPPEVDRTSYASDLPADGAET